MASTPSLAEQVKQYFIQNPYRRLLPYNVARWISEATYPYIEQQVWDVMEDLARAGKLEKSGSPPKLYLYRPTKVSF